MSARAVEYIVSLVDKFSAVANKIADSSAKAATSANNMGRAVNAAETSLARLKPPPALAGLPGQFERAAAGANKLAAATNTANAAMAKASAKASSTAVVGGGGGGKVANGFMAWIAGDAALHAIDHAVGRAAEIDTMLEKLRFGLGGDTDMVKRSYDAAFAMSGKYKNTTVAENLHILDDLRANLPHQMKDIIEHDFEPFVQLHGFFKAWEGGKHAGNAKAALKDISTAIRSGELLGNTSGDDLAKHAKNLAVARVVFGEKFNLQGYFTAQKAAATALSAADDTFKNIDFAALEQRLGAGAGTALATLQNKTVGGIMMRQGSAEAWRRLGLVDMNNVKLDKQGKIDPKSMVGKDWLKGGSLWGSNPTDAIMTVLSPALGNVAGLQALAGMKSAWQSGDVDKLVAINKKIDRNKLSKELAGLGYDRNAVKQLTETILGAASLLRDRQQWQKVLTDFNNFQSYDQAKQAFSSQVDRLFQGLTGRTFVPWVTKQINSMADAVGSLADKVNSNPILRGSINTGATAAGIMAVARALTWLTRIPALGPIGAALYIGSEVAANWDAVADAVLKLTGIDITPFAGTIEKIKAAITSLGDAMASAFKGDMSKIFDIMFASMGPNGPHKPALPATPPPGQPLPAPVHPLGFAGGLAAPPPVQVQTQVQTKIDPIVVQVPPVTVNVTGPGLTGQASTQPQAVTSPRGQTTVVTVPGPTVAK